MPQLRPRPTVPSSRGFTLVELMVVVVIIGILSALAVPKFIAITGENQLDGDANALYQDLLWARISVLKTNKPYRISFSETTVDGSPRLKWEINEVTDISTNATILRRTGITGVSVNKGTLSTTVAMSGKSAILTNGLGATAQGLQGKASASTTCTNGTSETWADGIQICPGALGDAETGGIRLISTRSKAREYLIMFDRDKYLDFRILRRLGNEWEVK